MKRKDYALLAKFIKGLKGYTSTTPLPATEHDPTTKEYALVHLVPLLKKDNSNFNVPQFTKDCGL